VIVELLVKIDVGDGGTIGATLVADAIENVIADSQAKLIKPILFKEVYEHENQLRA
jgi:hypothetical protein